MERNFKQYLIELLIYSFFYTLFLSSTKYVCRLIGGELDISVFNTWFIIATFWGKIKE